MKYAFRCNNCGRLEEGAHAGDREIPRGCRVCGKGVHYEIDASGQPVAIDDPDNWTVLADASDKELKPILAHHAITAGDIKRYHPSPAPPPDREPQFIERSVEDGVDAKDVPS